MKLAVVSGDGLPVSGVLTVFRSVVEQARATGLLQLPVAADLGYSWRPDKAEFFPEGPPAFDYPQWLEVTGAVPAQLDRAALAAELAAIRLQVAAAADLGPEQRRELHSRIDALAVPYAGHFEQWLHDHNVDWLVAINMTLSDAVPVSEGLRRAARARWSNGRPGGVLYWDHDLFGSCAYEEHGKRVYPVAPNEFTPVPGACPADRWAVVSPALAAETLAYPTALRARLVPNVLPAVPRDGLNECHREFLAQNGITPERPVILVPTRVSVVKGVEISLDVFAGMRDACARAGIGDPALLVFGSLDEEPGYADTVVRAAHDLGLEDAVTFLDGVPLSTLRTASGRWRLDEADLLALARATGGAVLFTPDCTDVESVGLGPALAAVADLPCAATAYQAFDHAYGSDFARVAVVPEEAQKASSVLVEWMIAVREGQPWVKSALQANRRRVAQRFPDGPWADLLHDMHRSLSPSAPHTPSHTIDASPTSAIAGTPADIRPATA
ncbi:hypothetical protein DMH18_26505 [Streptomyces sp. WAC 06783]|nr:hypothetical protein DMH18_26505 [Streptomyces sp. WAC 06783]